MRAGDTMRYLTIGLLLAALLPQPAALAGEINAQDIIWDAPVTADDGTFVYEVPPVEAEPLPPPNACHVADSPFARAWLEKGHIAGRPVIIIVIDDMGVDARRSAAVAALPYPVTLAYLPYARNVQRQVYAARAAKGRHEIIVHMPMQPESPLADPGPDALLAGLDAAELQRRIDANLDAFTGYRGINNHMGSLFTQDRAGMDMLMADLKKRGVYFLDSRTEPRSVAEDAAHDAGIPATHRDVFLDHVETPAAVAAALKKTETIARSHGVAIAIGHPKDVTIEGLRPWLAGVEARGFTLMTLGDWLHKRDAGRP